MICKFSVENFKAFAEKVEIVFFANGNIKRLDYNYVSVGNKNVLKTVGFYGPNNTGKTCILLSFAALRALMLNEPHDSFANAFANKGDVTSFNVEYFINNSFYVYSVDYNNRSKKYEKERLTLKTYDNSMSTEAIIFERSAKKLMWKGIRPDLAKADIRSLFSLSFPFMIVSSDTNNEIMSKARKDYIDFANSIVFIKMDTAVNITKTISLMQNDTKASKFINEFVKNCDLHIDDFGFDDNVVSDTNIDNELKIAMNNPSFVKESIKFYSKHNGYRVPSVFFDSVGTMKLVALSGYIYEALSKGKTLIVDEIDSSLHHIITKSIVAMFSNLLNAKAQLLFTTHDVLLLDLKELFRKDQIWLVDILDQSSSKICRMSDRFTARSESGVRGDEDITDYYLKGQFGSIPSPDLFASLEEAISDE
jgi:hypothetical protein